MLVSWANFRPEEHALGGGNCVENSLGTTDYDREDSRQRGDTIARLCDKKVL